MFPVHARIAPSNDDVKSSACSGTSTKQGKHALCLPLLSGHHEHRSHSSGTSWASRYPRSSYFAMWVLCSVTCGLCASAVVARTMLTIFAGSDAREQARAQYKAASHALADAVDCIHDTSLAQLNKFDEVARTKQLQLQELIAANDDRLATLRATIRQCSSDTISEFGAGVTNLSSDALEKSLTCVDEHIPLRSERLDSLVVAAHNEIALKLTDAIHANLNSSELPLPKSSDTLHEMPGVVENASQTIDGELKSLAQATSQKISVESAVTIPALVATELADAVDGFVESTFGKGANSAVRMDEDVAMLATELKEKAIEVRKVITDLSGAIGFLQRTLGDSVEWTAERIEEARTVISHILAATVTELKDDVTSAQNQLRLQEQASFKNFSFPMTRASSILHQDRKPVLPDQADFEHNFMHLKLLTSRPPPKQNLSNNTMPWLNVAKLRKARQYISSSALEKDAFRLALAFDCTHVLLKALWLIIELVSEAYSEFPLVDIREISTLQRLSDIWGIFLCRHSLWDIVYTFATEVEPVISSITRHFVWLTMLAVGTAIFYTWIVSWANACIRSPSTHSNEVRPIPGLVQLFQRHVDGVASDDVSLQLAKGVKTTLSVMEVVNKTAIDHLALIQANQSALYAQVTLQGQELARVIQAVDSCFPAQVMTSDRDAKGCRLLNDAVRSVDLFSLKWGADTADLIRQRYAVCAPEDRALEELQHQHSCAVEKVIYLNSAFWWMWFAWMLLLRYVGKTLVKCLTMTWWRYLTAGRVQFVGYCAESGDVHDATKLRTAIKKHLRELKWKVRLLLTCIIVAIGTGLLICWLLLAPIG